MQYTEIYNLIRALNLRYGEEINVYLQNDVVSGKYLYLDDKDLFFTDNTSVPIKQIKDISR